MLLFSTKHNRVNIIFKNNNFGFTIIELLVVISIIGILSTISVVGFNNARQKARDSKRIVDTKQLATALNIYFNDIGAYPISETAITLGVSPNLVLCDAGFVASASSCSPGKIYMAKVPVNPSPSGAPYSYISPSATPGNYSMTFTLEKSFGTLSYGEVTATNFGMANTPVAPQFACGDSVIYSGDTYPTVSINGQCWFAKNLNVGTKVVGTLDQGTSCATIQKYCYSDSDANCTTDGGLYQWDQAMCGAVANGSQGICPSGWHIPTDNEQYLLEDFLNTDGSDCDPDRDGSFRCDPAGTILKANSALWSTNTGTDTYGFSALPGGFRISGGTFSLRNLYGMFWSSSQYNSVNAWRRDFGASYTKIQRYSYSKMYGCSVRCIKN